VDVAKGWLVECVVVPPAELDVATSEQFAETLAQSPSNAVVIVDCSRLQFIDSSALNVVVEARERQRAGGGDLRFRQAGGIVRRAIEVAGLNDLLED
jgi:anti-anti-sigma factor